MVISNKKYKKSRIWYNRFRRFGFYKEIPPVKIFRKTSFFGWLILFALILIFIISKVFKNSEEPVHPAMGILTYTVAAIGFFIKLVLSYIFPEIKLNEKGIKFLGKDMVFWKDIKSITTRRDKFLNQTIIIKKRNGRINVTTIKDVEFSNLQIYLKSFLKKYGNIQ